MSIFFQKYLFIYGKIPVGYVHMYGIWIIVMDIFGKFLDKLEMDYKILFKLI